MYQVVLNMLVTKDLSNKFFDYIDPWGETIAYIAWIIKASHHHTIKATPRQDIFIKDMIFNLVSGVYWLVITAGKQ